MSSLSTTVAEIMDVSLPSGMPQHSFSSDKAGHWLLLGAISLVFGLTLGIRIGELNLYAYLLHGMHEARPEFLQQDWFAVSRSYHIPWNCFVSFLFAHHFLEGGLLMGTAVMLLGFGLSLFCWFDVFTARPILPWILTLLLCAGTFTKGIGDFILIPTAVEPFGLAGMLLVMGVAFLLHEKLLAAGICLGLSSLIHSHFAVLLTLTLPVAFLLAGRYTTARTRLQFWLPFAILAAPSLFLVLQYGFAPGAAEASRIEVAAAPQQFLPWAVSLRPIFVSLGCCLFGLAGFRFWRPRRFAVAHSFFLVCLTMVAASLVLSPFLNRLGIYSVGQAMLWRISVFVNLVGLVFGSLFLSSYQAATKKPGHLTTSLVTALVALAILFTAGTLRLKFAVVVAAAVPVILALGRRSSPALQSHKISFPAAIGVATLGLAVIAAAEIPTSHLDLRAADPDRAHLYAWIRQHTEPDAVFAVPPDLKDFRLIAGRAIVVDWSALPLYPPDVLEWKRRMTALTGLQSPYNLPDAMAGYRKLDADRLNDLHRRYHVTYFVQQGQGSAFQSAPLYRDDHFQVLQYSAR